MNAPGEVLVDVVHCVDYGTIYSLTFVNSQFHNVAVRNAEKMAKRRNFELTFTETALRLVVDGSNMPSVVIDEGRRTRRSSSAVDALKEVVSVVGLHAVTKLSVDHGDWLRLPIAQMFAVLPAMEYATSLSLCYEPSGGTTPAADYVDAIVTRFSHLQELELTLQRPFDWTYLRRDSALKLRTFQIKVRREPQSSEEEVLRFCTAMSRLPALEPKRFVLISPFLVDRFRQEAVERVVEVLSESQRVISLVLPTGPLLQLPERNFLAAAANNGDGKKDTLFLFRRAEVAICVDRRGYTMITNDPECFLA